MWELVVASFVSIGSSLISKGIEGFASELGTSGGKEAARQVRAGFYKCFNKIKSKLSDNPQASKAVEDFEIEPENEEKQKDLGKMILDLANKDKEIASEMSELVKQAESHGFKLKMKMKVDEIETFRVGRKSEFKDGEINLDAEMRKAQDVTLFDESKVGG